MQRRSFLKTAAALLVPSYAVLKPKIDLRPWCDERGGSLRFDLELPFAQNGHTYAADNRACVRLPGELGADFDRQLRLPPVDSVFWDAFGCDQVMWSEFVGVKTKVGEDVACPECFRGGQYDCGLCRGTGGVFFVEDVCGLSLSPYYAQQLRRLGSVQVANLSNVTTPSVSRWTAKHGQLKCLAFRTADLQGLVMGCEVTR